MNKARSGGLANPMKIAGSKVELGDTLLFLYVLAFVRQYFWVIDNNLLAWTLSRFAIIGLLVLLHLDKAIPGRKIRSKFLAARRTSAACGLYAARGFPRSFLRRADLPSAPL